MPETMRTGSRWIAAYVRVSSKSQNEATQRAMILRRATADDVREEAIVWYAEKESSRSPDRLALKNLRQDIRSGKIATLYVFKIDRLARTGIRDVLELVDECREAACRVWSTSEGIEVTGKHYELIVSALAWAAELELEANAERLAAARARVEEDGGTWGRPRRVGVVDEDKMLELADGGLSMRDIAVRLQIPKATVARGVTRARERREDRLKNPSPEQPASSS